MSVHLVFPGPGGVPYAVSLPFVRGRPLRDYLRDPSVKRYGMIGKATRMRVTDHNRRLLKLRHQVRDETTVHFQKAGGR